MGRGKTKSGIKFQIDERIKNDARFLFYANKLNKAKATKDNAEPIADYIMSLVEIIFGGEEGTIAFMNEVAAKNKGVCDTTTMMNELGEIIDAVNLKNSSSSPK